jgi:hypothetical protein
MRRSTVLSLPTKLVFPGSTNSSANLVVQVDQLVLSYYHHLLIIYFLVWPLFLLGYPGINVIKLFTAVLYQCS